MDYRLLPADRYIASLLGLSDEEYAWYKEEVYRRAAEGPQPSVVAGVETLAIISLSLTVLSVGFTIAASFFKPKPNESGPAQLKAANRGGRARTENERFVPRYGFDSSQDITTLGAVIPIVYALREDGFGGVRVNMPLLWSQLYSLGGSQLLRAVFLLGEGPMGAVDAANFASGGNTLASYDFGNSSANAGGSRMTVYGRYADSLTTRIRSGNRIYGRDANADRGNAQTEGAGDVFQVRRGNSWTTDFCSASRPNNQTTFGVYGLIGNNLGMRVNPVVKPQVQAQLIPEGDDGDALVKCTYDDVAWAQRKKTQTIFGSRSGITSQGMGSIGGNTTYTLFQSSDKDTAFSRDIRNLTDISKWDESTVKEQIRGTAGGSFNKSIGADVDSKGKWTFEFDNTQEDSLVHRLGVRITHIELTGTKLKKGILRAQITFDTRTINGEELWTNDATDEEVLSRLETLKATKFRLKFANEVDPDAEDDDVVVRYTLRVRVKHKRKQKFKYKRNPIYQNGFISGYDGDLEVENIAYKPIFKIRDDAPIVAPNPAYGEQSNVFTVEGNGVLRVTVQLEFPVKNLYIEKCEDIAATVAGRQKSWDDSLIEGELYKIGSGLAICTDRTPSAFVSNSDITSGVGNSVTARFSTVRTGSVTSYSQADLLMDGKTWSESRPNVTWRNTATTGGHILRCAIASISTTRPCRAVELGIRSRLGIRVSGLCNFKESLSYSECDDRACLDHKNQKVDRGATLKVDVHQSNTISAPVERYSFFCISYRQAGSTGAFQRLNNAYGTRGATQQNIFNYIQLNMPSVQRWEFQIEPYSGWEVRNNSVGTLYVLDAHLETRQTVSEVGGITVTFHGTSVPRSEDTFAISVGRRRENKGSIGIARTDDRYGGGGGDYSYIDTWGKLAEAFVFEEVRSSAESAPEHEVVYINEICPNTVTPNYDNLALIGLNIMSSQEWQQFSQFSCYVTQGKTCRRLLNSLSVGPSHLFPDILLDLLTNTTYGRGDLITDSMIDLDSFRAAAQWCRDRNYFYDGVIADRINLRQWAADTAAAHLLIFGESDGKFFLRPAFTTGAVPIRGLFTAGNIAEGSFQLQYLDPEDRDPIQVSVRYREERASSDLANPGLFPVVREILVSEGIGDGLPVETLDLSDYCTNKQHAIDAAKFIIRMRRIPTHTVRFTTTHEGVLAQMAPSDYIRLALDSTQYDQFNNGAVTADGTLISSKSLTDGSYDVVAWNGEAATAPYDATLTVTSGGTQAAPRGIVFTVKQGITQVRTYQIERINPNDDGTFTIEAVHMPTKSSGILELADGFDSTANWRIEE